MKPTDALARALLSGLFLSAGAKTVRSPSGLAPKAEAVTAPIERLARQVLPAKLAEPVTADNFVRLNGAAQVGAGVALATGAAPRLGAGVLAASLVPTTFAGHAFWKETDPKARAAQRLQVLKNAAIAGGLLTVALGEDRS